MKGLAGKRVVVTGGTSGIGAATAQRFREEACEVVVLARTPGPDVIPCDVSDKAQVEAAFEEIGSLDVLIDNAGVSLRSPALDIDTAQWA
jgi:3-oxoacyl-[acyl-carrier protein] reductase